MNAWEPTFGAQAMRFIITEQANADRKTTEQQSEFDVELFKAYMRVPPLRAAQLKP